MAMLPLSLFGLLGWLRQPLSWFVNARVTPQNPREEYGIGADKPVCYVLRTRSLADMMVLDKYCAERGMPRPREGIDSLSSNRAGVVTLSRLGLVQPVRKSVSTVTPALSKLVQRAETDPNFDVQIIPVSIIWGRNPGRDEKSLFKLLFFDDENAGILQKAFIVLAHGRQSLVRFGRPLSLRQLVNEGLGPEQTAKKLRRVMRVHFHNERTAALGPSLYERSQLVHAVVSSKSVREAIEDESRRSGESRSDAETKAREYAREIAADLTFPVVRFFEIILGWLWHKIFEGVEVKHGERPRNLPRDCEIVYVASHRSHMDYLLLSYVIYYLGLMPPHTAAGINLNFWPVGFLLRRAGAFFLRRSFRGNRLYTTVFHEYLHLLLTRGHSVSFFPEGGRSRTGRLLQPKTGMMAMVVQSFLRDADRPIILVPIFISYDKVMEVSTYLHEIRGSAKRKESMRQLLSARKNLKNSHGRAYLSFGEPIDLAAFLNKRQPMWQEGGNLEETKPVWLSGFVEDLSQEVMAHINATAVLGPVALVGLALLGSPQKAMTVDELIGYLNKLLTLQRRWPYSSDESVCEGTAQEYLHHCEKIKAVQRFSHPGGDVIYMDERQASLMSYYRNNILHMFALPSLVASYFQHNDEAERQAVIAGALELYPFLQAELFLRWEPQTLPEALEKLLAGLVELGFLTKDGERLRRPSVTAPEFSYLMLLGRALGQTFNRYAISAALLVESGRHGLVERTNLEAECQKLAHRVAILHGSTESDVFDKTLFQNFIDHLKRLGYVEQEAGGLMVRSNAETLARNALELLSADIRQSIQRIAAKPDSAEQRLLP